MPDGPVSFGYKMSWLAVRSNDERAVAKRLSLMHLHEASWAEGIDGIYDDDHLLLVTPPLNGWVLVAGLAVSQTGEPNADARLLALLTDLSAHFGEAQAFGTHRVVEHHYWLLARQGRLARGFAYLGESGEVLLNEGDPTSAEVALLSGPAEDWLPDEETVLAVAAAWSIDPSSLDEAPPTSRPPLLGRVVSP